MKMRAKILLLIFVVANVKKGSTLWRPLCKDNFNIAWWAIPPYIYERNDTVAGILPIIMKQMVQHCCNKQVNLSYSLKVANKVEAVEQVSNGTADFVLPLIVRSGKTKFLSFPHITVVESPGIAFYSSAPLSAGKLLVKILVTAAPILLLITIMVIIAGTSYWLIEKRYESSIIPGILNGIWWAFVSMTTVGYGDISPTTKKGRFAAILWILFGIAACSLFVAVVSSVLTAACLKQEANIRGSEIAVISGSQEHALAIRRSARPIPLSSVEEIVYSLEEGTSSGALLDSYVAGFYQHQFKKFRLNDLQEDFFSYGFVLMPSVLKYEECFKNYLASRQNELFSIVSKNIIPLKKTKAESRAEEMSMKIFEYGDVKLHLAVPFVFGFVVIVFSLCILKERMGFQRKHVCHGKTAKYELYSKANDLRVLRENHQKDMIECLLHMKQDTEILQDYCSKVSSKTESEARYRANENGSTIETRL